MTQNELIQVVAEDSGLTVDAVQSRLDGRRVFYLSRGIVTCTETGVLHIHLVEASGLDGRKLLAECWDVLRLLSNIPVLKCPVRIGNHRARRFVEFFGFKQYTETASHWWFAKESNHVH